MSLIIEYGGWMVTASENAGLCANTGTTTHDDPGEGTFTFGYGYTIIDYAVANALKQVGIVLVGYSQWHVKMMYNESTQRCFGTRHCR